MKLNKVLKLVVIMLLALGIIFAMVPVKATDEGETNLDDLFGDDDEFDSTVDIEVSSVELDKTSLDLKVGETGKITVTVKPSDATNKNVTYTSSDTEVATVSDGIITAVKEGKATITVKSEKGDKTAECTVTVTSKDTATGSKYENNTNTTADKDLSKAGIEDWNMIPVIALICIVSGVFAVKKLKDYKNI